MPFFEPMGYKVFKNINDVLIRKQTFINGNVNQV